MQIDEQSFTPPRPTFTITPINDSHGLCDICQHAKAEWLLLSDAPCSKRLNLCLACCLRQQIALMTINS